MIKRFLLAWTCLFFVIPSVLADQAPTIVPETADSFKDTFHLDNSSLDNIIHYALNPALKTITSNSYGANCADITNAVPYQWCVNTATKTMNLNVSPTQGSPSWSPVFTIKNDGSILTTSVPPGIVADSTTDVASALNTALALGDVFLPSTNNGAYYRAASTITVPFGSTLYGVGQVSPPGAGNLGGARIVCDAAVSPCIKVGTGNINNVAAIRNIGQGRAGGAPGSTTIGIWVFGGQMSNMTNVQSDNNGINFLWGRSTPGAGAGVSHTASGLVSTRAVDVHMMFDGIPDVRISRSHIGSVGPNDYHANAAFRFSCTQNDCSGPGGVNTINIDNMQVNQGLHRIEYMMDFVNADTSFAATYGIFNFDKIYAESLNHIIHTDSSWKRISELKIANSVINTNTTTAEGAGGRFFSLDAATAVDRWHITNSTLYGAADGGVQAFRLNPAPTSGCGICELHISNSSLYGDMYLTGFAGSTASIVGTTFSTNYTVDGGGAWAYYNELGTNIGGTYSVSAGTNTAVFNNRQTNILGAAGVDCTGITAGTVTVRHGVMTHC